MRLECVFGVFLVWYPAVEARKSRLRSLSLAVGVLVRKRLGQVKEKEKCVCWRCVCSSSACVVVVPSTTVVVVSCPWEGMVMPVDLLDRHHYPRRRRRQKKNQPKLAFQGEHLASLVDLTVEVHAFACWVRPRPRRRLPNQEEVESSPPHPHSRPLPLLLPLAAQNACTSSKQPRVSSN